MHIIQSIFLHWLRIDLYYKYIILPFHHQMHILHFEHKTNKKCQKVLVSSYNKDNL